MAYTLTYRRYGEKGRNITKLYAYFMNYPAGTTQFDKVIPSFSCIEAEAKYISGYYYTCSRFITRSPFIKRQYVNSGKVHDCCLIMSKPSEITARAIFRRHYEKLAEDHEHRAKKRLKITSEQRRYANQLSNLAKYFRKVAASL